MMKFKKVKVLELQENNLVFFNGARYFAIDANQEERTVLFQSEDGTIRQVLGFDEDVLQTFDADRGFEVVEDKFLMGENKEGHLPKRKTRKSAGYDFYCPDMVSFERGEIKTIYTNVKAFMLDDEELRLSLRSSVAGRGFRLVNAIGIIDSDYYSNQENDGNIGFILEYVGEDKTFAICRGERIGQGVFSKYLTAYDDNADGVRQGGFGSTGR